MKCSRLIRAIVSTISIPSHLLRYKAGSATDQSVGGQFWTPIPRLRGNIAGRMTENGPVPPADHNSTDGQCSPSFSEFVGMKIGKLAPPEQDKNSRPFKIF
jgi:hypothetical protein